MAIINERFNPGDKFRSAVNGERFTIVAIMHSGMYETKSGGRYRIRHTKVVFHSEKTNEDYRCGIETAKRLQLEKF